MKKTFIKRGDIILVNLAFKDFSGFKIRPALVISNKLLLGDDLIVCSVSTQKTRFNSIKLHDDDFTAGTLPKQSYVLFDYITTVDRNLILRKVARIKQKVVSRVVRIIYKFLR